MRSGWAEWGATRGQGRAQPELPSAKGLLLFLHPSNSSIPGKARKTHTRRERDNEEDLFKI